MILFLDSDMHVNVIISIGNSSVFTLFVCFLLKKNYSRIDKTVSFFSFYFRYIRTLIQLSWLNQRYMDAGHLWWYFLCQRKMLLNIKINAVPSVGIFCIRNRTTLFRWIWRIGRWNRWIWLVFIAHGNTAFATNNND